MPTLDWNKIDLLVKEVNEQSKRIDISDDINGKDDQNNNQQQGGYQY